MYVLLQWKTRNTSRQEIVRIQTATKEHAAASKRSLVLLHLEFRLLIAKRIHPVPVGKSKEKSQYTCKIGNIIVSTYAFPAPDHTSIAPEPPGPPGDVVTP